MRTLDLVVIGRGLFGSAAGRHLALNGHDVTLIGPSEPADWTTHDGVFASHYDEGRITRVLDRSRVWAQLADAAINRYAEIERASGVRFYSEQGFLALSTPGLGYVERVLQVGRELNTECELLDEHALRARFPRLDTEGRVGAWQPKRAGHISPRRLVAAQTGAAIKAGAKLLQDWVRRVHLNPDGVHIELGNGSVRARAVLVATGAFTEPALLGGTSIPIDVQGRTVIAAEVPTALRDELRALPGMIGAFSQGDDLGDWYALPAIRYPDGRDYMKIGTGSFMHPLTTLAEKQAWFRGPPSAPDIETLRQHLFKLVPALAGAPTIAFNCAYTATLSHHPYIDWIEPGRLAVCTGGNGAGAKSSDEIGRLGASLLMGESVPDVFHLPR